MDIKEAKKEKIARRFEGVVVSDKGNKTIVVKVEKMKEHPVYKKKYRSGRKYKVHDEKNEFKIGETVIFEECRPLSKDKKWRVVKKIK